MTVDGRAVLVAGFTGSGKTEWTMRDTRREPRLLVWDSQQQWSQRGLVTPVTTISQLKAAIVADIRRPGRLRIGYAGPIAVTVIERGRERKHSFFPAFCRLAWIWLRSKHGGALVVEELADVTSPGKAPDAWGEILRKSRKLGSKVYGLTQRPAESDKTIVSNAAAIHTGFMGYPSDRKYMALCLGVPVREIEALRPLDWLERDLRTQELRRGRVRF